MGWSSCRTGTRPRAGSFRPRCGDQPAVQGQAREDPRPPAPAAGGPEVPGEARGRVGEAQGPRRTWGGRCCCPTDGGRTRARRRPRPRGAGEGPPPAPWFCRPAWPEGPDARPQAGSGSGWRADAVTLRSPTCPGLRPRGQKSLQIWGRADPHLDSSLLS